MKLLKKSMFYSVIFLLFSCTTVKYGAGTDDFIFSEDTTDDKVIEEMVIPFSTNINGIPVKGDELHILGAVVSPDAASLYMVVDFPRFGILKTDDGGKNVSCSVFDTDYFSYKTEDDSEKGNLIRHRKNITVHSAFSGENIALSVGPFLFISKDNGVKWCRSTPFLELETNFIRKLLVSPEGELVVFTDKKVAVSSNWDNKLKRFAPTYANLKNKDIRLTDAVYFNGELYISYMNESISISRMYELNYKYLIGNNQKIETGSGVFIMNSEGKLTPTGYKSPFILFTDAGKLFGQNIFNYDMYKINMDENFRNTAFYKTGSLNNGKNSASYYNSVIVNSTLKNMYQENREIYDLTNRKTISECKVETGSVSNNNQEENDIFYYINSGIKRIKKEPFNFNFTYNPYNFLCRSGEGNLNSLTYTLSNGDVQLKVEPEEAYLKKLISHKISKKYEYDMTTPFLRKKSELFVDTEMIGAIFPFKLEFCSLKGGGVTTINSKILKDTINPDTKTKSGYWYKNIEKKRHFRLEFVLGSDEKNDLLYYPAGMLRYQNGYILIMNYYDEDRCYKELFKINIK